MNYLERVESSSERIKKVINGLNVAIEDFYNSSEKSDDKIRLHSSTLEADELLAFNQAFLEGNITEGKYTALYQQAACDRFNSSYSVSSNSGSSANLIAIAALSELQMLQPGDKVLVPSLAWSTTIFPLIQYGLIPVYIDISETDFNISTSEILKAIKEHEPRALCIIHTYGNPVNLDEIMDLCNKYNLLLIEDTCESMGATWEGRSLGSFGIVGTFSTYYSHHICTLEGGLTITSNSDLYNTMLSIRSHGWTRNINFNVTKVPEFETFDPSFLFINTGYNLRLSDPQASMGIVQLKKLDTYVKSRSRSARLFIKHIEKSAELSHHITFPHVHPKAQSSWFGFPILLKKLSARQVKQLRSYLLERNIETRPFLAGDFSRHPVNNKFPHIRHNLVSIKMFDEKSFALPCHQSLSSDNIDYICSMIKQFFLSELN